MSKFQIFYKRVDLDFKAIFRCWRSAFFIFVVSERLQQRPNFFSGLKLATRLKHEESKKTLDRFNDYYLLGNLLSVSVAIGYVYAFQHIR